LYISTGSRQRDDAGGRRDRPIVDDRRRLQREGPADGVGKLVPAASAVGADVRLPLA
jgi:hypothetical protein